MSWFFIALVGPLLWSVVNHIDKYLLSKYFRSGGVGGLLIFSSIFGILVLPVAFFFKPAVSSLSFTSIFILLALGIITAFTLLLYLYALDMDEASIVAPFYQVIPIFGFVLGYFVLGETITITELVACIVLFLGGVVLSFEIGEGMRVHFKLKLVGVITIATFLIAVVEVVFKMIALEDSFWASTFWQYTGLTIFGVFLFFIPSYRSQFLAAVKDNRKWVFSLNAASEITTLVANLAFSFATLLAPLALVLVVDSYRPLFVLVIGILLSIFLPHISEENISIKHLVHKIFAVILMIIGTYLLYVN